MSYFVAGVLTVTGLLFFIIPFIGNAPLSVIIIGVAFIAMARFVYLSVARECLTIDDYSISVKGLFSYRTVQLDAVTGYRIIDQKPPLFVLATETESNALGIPNGLEGGGEVIEWLKGRFADLDARDYAASAANLVADPQFGDTRLERLIRLRNATLVSLVAKVLALLMMVLDFFFPINLPFMLVVFVLPWGVVAAIWYFKGALGLYRGKADAAPSAGLLLGVAAAVACVNACTNYDLYMFATKGVLSLAAVAGLVVAVWLHLCKHVVIKEAQKTWLVAGIIAAAVAYSYGLLIFANCYRDPSTGEDRHVVIEGKYISYTSRYHDKIYHLRLSWPGDDGGKSLEVQGSVYEGLRVGGLLTVHVYGGRLGIPWYRMDIPGR